MRPALSRYFLMPSVELSGFQSQQFLSTGVLCGANPIRGLSRSLCIKKKSLECTSNKRAPRGSIASLQQQVAVSAAVAVSAPPSLVSLAAVIVGWLVIAGSTVRSLPQIVRILRSKSVQGLSLTSFLSELVAYTITVRYNIMHSYPFSTYGDTAICWVQNVAIVALIFWLNKNLPNSLKAVLSISYLSFLAFICSGQVSYDLMAGLQASSVVILGLLGRLPQIILNYRRGNSGELSITSTGLSVAGNLARVFTTLILVKDTKILASAASQLALNGILLWQTLDTARQSSQLSTPQTTG